MIPLRILRLWKFEDAVEFNKRMAGQRPAFRSVEKGGFGHFERPGGVFSAPDIAIQFSSSGLVVFRVRQFFVQYVAFCVIVRVIGVESVDIVPSSLAGTAAKVVIQFPQFAAPIDKIIAITVKSAATSW